MRCMGCVDDGGEGDGDGFEAEGGFLFAAKVSGAFAWHQNIPPQPLWAPKL